MRTGAAAVAAAPVRSVVNQLVLYDLLRTMTDGVHVAEPLHLVPDLEGFGHALGGGQVGDRGFELFPGRAVDLQKVFGQLAGEEQGGEGAVMLLL